MVTQNLELNGDPLLLPRHSPRDHNDRLCYRQNTWVLLWLHSTHLTHMLEEIFHLYLLVSCSYLFIFKVGVAVKWRGKCYVKYQRGGERKLSLLISISIYFSLDQRSREIWNLICALCSVTFRGWLCHPMAYSPPGSSEHGIFLSRILEWVAISFSNLIYTYI